MKDDKEFTAWLIRAHKNSKEKLGLSSTYVGVVTNSFLEDPLCALQLGLAVLMDKPIALIVSEGTKIPKSLQRAALLVRYVDTKNEEALHAAVQEIAEFIEKREKRDD